MKDVRRVIPAALIFFDELPRGLFVGVTVHGFQHPAVDVLKRHIHIPAHPGLRRHERDERVIHHLWLQIHEPHAVKAEPDKLPDEGDEPRFSVKVDAVAGDILRDEYQLLHAVVGERPCLGDEVLLALRAVLAAD